LSNGSPTAGRYEGALLGLKALGDPALVAALVGSAGVGLVKLGEVLDRLDVADRDRLVELTLVSVAVWPFNHVTLVDR
jgi:hypothetical protein